MAKPRSLIFKDAPPTPFVFLRKRYERTPHAALFQYSFEYLCCHTQQPDVAAFIGHKCEKVWTVSGPPQVKLVLEAALATVEKLCREAPPLPEYMLRLFGDRFIPLALWLQSNTAEDVEDLCQKTAMPNSKCLFSDMAALRVNFVNTSGFWSHEVHGKKMPLVHLLSKCLPQRCQARNLNRVTAQHLEDCPALHSKLHKIVICALLGNFKTSTERPFLDVRVAVFQSFRDVSVLSKLVSEHFNVVLFALKQYVVHEVACVPQLRARLVQSGKWLQFEKNAAAAMAALCADMDATSENFLQRASTAFDLCLNKKTNRTNAKTKRKSDRDRHIRSIVRTKEHKDVLKRHFSVIYQYMCRIPLNCDTPWYLLVTLGIKRDVVRAIYNDKSKERLSKLIAGDVGTTVRRFLNTYDLRHSVRLFALAPHHCAQQQKALRARYSLVGDIPPTLAQFVMCTQCKTLKSYSKKNLGAYGNAYVLVDDETQEYYCSQHRSHKNTVPRAEAPISSFLKMVHVHKKSRKRSDKYEHCESTALLKMPSHGLLLSFFGNLYMLCPQCATTCAVSDMGFRGAFFACGKCMGVN